MPAVVRAVDVRQILLLEEPRALWIVVAVTQTDDPSLVRIDSLGAHVKGEILPRRRAEAAGIAEDVLI